MFESLFPTLVSYLNQIFAFINRLLGIDFAPADGEVDTTK